MSRATEPTAAELTASVARAHPDVYVIVAPPRSCSTLLARVLWNSPRIAFYAHEPFDATYHDGGSLGDVLDRLLHPLDLRRHPPPRTGRDLLVKELPFQVGAAFPLLAGLTRHPIVFLVRDPRLTIASRMRMRTLIGQPAEFPTIESGWQLLHEQVRHCRERSIPHVLVEATELRRRPADIVSRVFATVGLPFDDAMLRWPAAGEIEFGLTIKGQEAWNRRVLSSTSIEPPDESPPDLDEFPQRGGMRAHVEAALALYRDLLAAPERLDR